MKTWKPDTCECIVEEIYPVNSGDPIIGGQVIRKCSAHTDVPDDELYGVLYSNPDGENKRKNQMHRLLLGLDEVKGLNLEERKTNEDGSDAGLQLKKGVEFSWSFEGTGKNRVLKAEVKGATLNASQKVALRNAAKNRFGNGKVEVA